ncbi:MAG: hypothetical protein HOO90_04150 [Methylotenera sp.]|uniref:hypothetical protein n=1 Tax=Methylotenera sp. TaxID=2051956 RepID=UPI001831CF6B|nr:hypothetical protein [Methylotenera sp.]NOU24710.1 hypothetical protein [Methylotenera sp.]
MNNDREHIALSAYLNLLERNGISKMLIRQRELVILKLIPYLEEIHTDGFSFRNAVDTYFKQIDQSQWATCLPVIRDYFSFWSNDIKAIIALNQDHAFGVNPTEWAPIEADLKQLWNSLDEIILTTSEAQPLESYEMELRKSGADDFFVVACKKLVKLLLLLLRSAPHKQPVAYRKALDANLTLFSSAEAYKVSLKVGREFYYFWKGDASAPNFMQPALAMAA